MRWRSRWGSLMTTSSVVGVETTADLRHCESEEVSGVAIMRLSEGLGAGERGGLSQKVMSSVTLIKLSSDGNSVSKDTRHSIFEVLERLHCRDN